MSGITNSPENSSSISSSFTPQTLTKGKPQESSAEGKKEEEKVDQVAQEKLPKTEEVVSPKTFNAQMPPLTFGDQFWIQNLGQLFEKIMVHHHMPSFTERSYFVERVKLFGFSEVDLKKLWNMLPKTDENRQRTNHLMMGIAAAFAHEWGLDGHITIGDQHCKLEGNMPELMHANLAASVATYFALKKPKALSPEDQRAIVSSLEKSVDYSGVANPAADALRDYQAGELVTFNSGWPRHVVEVTLYKNGAGENFLAYTNRGNSQVGMNVYRIKGEVTQEILAKMMDTYIDSLENKQNLAAKLNKPNDQITKEEIINERTQFLEGNETDSLKNVLDLELIGNVEKSELKVGNCSWANCKGGFHAGELFKMMERAEKDGMTAQEAFEHLLEPANALFKDWEIDRRQQQLEFFLSLEPALRSGQVDMSLEDYYSMILAISVKLGLKTTAQQYRDAAAFPETVIPQKIGQMAQFVQDFLRQHPIPLSKIPLLPTKFAKNYLEMGFPGSYMIDEQKNSDQTISRTVLFLDGNGELQHRDIPENCLTTQDLHRLFPNLTLPLPKQLRFRGDYKKSDPEVFSDLKQKGQAFDTAQLALQHLQSHPAGTYAIFPSERRPGKYCVRFKLPNGELTRPRLLQTSKKQMGFPLEVFILEPYKMYYEASGQIMADDLESAQKLADKPPGSFCVTDYKAFYKRDDGTIGVLAARSAIHSPEHIEKLILQEMQTRKEIK
ncbi:MAG: hypothetical protein LLG04_13800 [Parachlamydia sp.]|nr:hypothetical protein [Parachlamydia sp.]